MTMMQALQAPRRAAGITADSFHWIGEALQPDGATWKIEAEFLARKES